jgi:hypothetical protein
MAVDIANRLQCTLTPMYQMACISIAIKFCEPYGVDFYFPGINVAELQQAEWNVLQTLGFTLR